MDLGENSRYENPAANPIETRNNHLLIGTPINPSRVANTKTILGIRNKKSPVAYSCFCKLFIYGSKLKGI
jgi:hypothetical protein